MSNEKKCKIRILTIFSVLSILSITIFACNGNSLKEPVPTPFFPVQKPEVRTSLLLLGNGKLIIENECIRLTGPDKSSDMLIWPRGYTIRVDDREILVVDQKSRVVARVGDTIKLGGGPTTAEMVAQFSEPALPENCTGPYWFVSEVIAN